MQICVTIVDGISPGNHKITINSSTEANKQTNDINAGLLRKVSHYFYINENKIFLQTRIYQDKIFLLLERDGKIAKAFGVQSNCMFLSR